MGQEANLEDFEGLEKSWQTIAFSSDPLIRSLHPFVDRLHPMQLYRCCLSLRRCFGLEAIVNPNAALSRERKREKEKSQ